MTERRGVSLLEVLVALAIVTVMIGLLLPAVQRVRAAADRTKSMNNLKQISLATEHFCSAFGRYPSGRPTNEDLFKRQEETIFIALLPYLDNGAIHAEWARYNKPGELTENIPVRYYISPADPSPPPQPPAGGSYAVNNKIVGKTRSVAPGGVTDGTSNTILYTEHYMGFCGPMTYFWCLHTEQRFPLMDGTLMRGATVANAPLGDAHPVPGPQPGTTRSSVPGLAFQVAPKLADCDPRVAQGPHRAGLLVALADGSVRTLPAATGDDSYMALLTPAAGDVPENGW